MATARCATILLLAMPFLACPGGARGAPADACTGTGQVAVTDPAGDGAASNPQLDLLDVSIAEHQSGPFAGRVVVRLRVQGLETPEPAIAAWWTLGWNGPSRNGMTSLVMSTCGSRRPTFTYSFSDSEGIGSSGAPDTAWFTGDGEIAFVLSRDRIGDPHSGETLRDISALALQFSHADTVCLPALIRGADGTGTGSYVMGTCVLAVPARSPVASFRLGPPIPNPATRALRVALDVPPSLAGGRAEAGVFDVHGRRVRALGFRAMAAGRSLLEWDLRDDSGLRVPPGSYWLRIGTGEQAGTRCIRVLR